MGIWYTVHNLSLKRVGEECLDEGGLIFMYSQKKLFGALVSLGIWGFVSGEVGVREERGMDGFVFEGLGNCVRAGMNPADADVGVWEETLRRSNWRVDRGMRMW